MAREINLSVHEYFDLTLWAMELPDFKINVEDHLSRLCRDRGIQSFDESGRSASMH